MRHSTGNVLRILLFIGVFIYCLYSDIQADAITPLRVFSELFAASAVYLIATLFSFTLQCTRNYLLAIIFTAAIAVFAGYKLDELVAAVSWLNTDLVAQIITIIVTLWILKDIIAIIRAFIPSSEDDHTKAVSRSENENYIPKPAKTAQQLLKENPEFMLDLSKRLEIRKGHKPTYEELIDYIDNEAFHLKTDDEINQEIQELVDNIRKNK